MGLKRQLIFAKTQRRGGKCLSPQHDWRQYSVLYYIFILKEEKEIWPLALGKQERERERNVFRFKIINGTNISDIVLCFYITFLICPSVFSNMYLILQKY